jgi:acyl phosphate:glycerol-3-phosphate acyltransferase
MDFIYPLIGYLLGSIPFGLLLAMLAGHGDIRKIGSGNIGATNVLRTGNKGLAALVLLLDGLKGTLAVGLSFATGDMLVIFTTALFVVLGHMYPVWLKFKGGKGVATALGAIVALLPLLFFIMIVIWLLMFAAFRISSLAALVAFAAAPVISALLLQDLNLACITGIMAILIFIKHRANIQRLLKNEEPKTTFGKKE